VRVRGAAQGKTKDKIHPERSGRYQASYLGARSRPPHRACDVHQEAFTKKMDAEHWLADGRRLIEHQS
jgi:hypothetical protein